jgi:hypothetical protein
MTEENLELYKFYGIDPDETDREVILSAIRVKLNLFYQTWKAICKMDERIRNIPKSNVKYARVAYDDKGIVWMRPELKE